MFRPIFRPHSHRPARNAFSPSNAFSLIEVLVAFAVLSLIMVMLVSIIEMTSKTWKVTTSKMQAFEDSQAAFDRVASLIAQAEHNPYWDNDDPTTPTKYQRASELQFLSLPMTALNLSGTTYPSHGVFFQAPTGKVASSTYRNMPLLLNAFGYMIEYGPDTAPSFLGGSFQNKYRFRLKEWRVPSDSLDLYSHTSGPTGKTYTNTASYSWITGNLASPTPKALADNVIAFVVNPRITDSTGTVTPLADPATFVYNSRLGVMTSPQYNQLPPEVELIMVAVDETSAVRVWNNSTNAPSVVGSYFSDPASVESDLKKLTDSLTLNKLKYIVMRSTVKIRGARWSQSQQ